MGRVLLVRHGQASFGADDYDVLSPAGHEQAQALGRHLAACGVVADDVLAGGMRRQQDTATATTAAAGWSTPVGTDPRWDEFDHLAVVGAHADPGAGGGRVDQTLDRRAFQAAFETATARWTAAVEPVDGVEPWSAFVARVRAGLDDAVRRAGPGRTVVVVSSGGPIAVAAAVLLDLPETSLPTAWSRLNTVLVNAGVSTVLVGATGARLLTYNEHAHLPPAEVTYR